MAGSLQSEITMSHFVSVYHSLVIHFDTKWDIFFEITRRSDFCFVKVDAVIKRINASVPEDCSAAYEALLFKNESGY